LKLESLEDRRLLAISWINRGMVGSDTDLFGMQYGVNAEIARQVVDRAINDWNKLIVDFDYDGDDNAATNNVFQLTINAQNIPTAPGTVTFGQATINNIDGNGRPTSATILMDNDAGVAPTNWFFDPTPNDNDEFTDINTRFEAIFPGAPQPEDFYVTILHEIGHAIGIATDAALAISAPALRTNAGTDQMNPAGTLQIFQNPSGQFNVPVTLTVDPGGQGTHIYEGPQDPAFPATPTHPNELMNPGRTRIAPGIRQLVSDLTVQLLADAYAYRVLLPSTLVNSSTHNFITEDSLKSNNSLQTATVLGSLLKVTVQDVSIFDVGDEDFYRYTAPNTGRLEIREFHISSPGNDINIQVLDRIGANITPLGQGVGTGNVEQIVIPVVAGETYFVRVFGINNSINNYDLEIENFPAPVPNAVFLHPLDDSGLSTNDNVTTNTTPRFFIEDDLFDILFMGIPLDQATGPEADVELQIVGANTGTFQIIDAAWLNGSIWLAAVTTPLPPDLYFVQAATRIRDGATPSATGRTQLSPPLWLSIVADEAAPRVSDVRITGLPAFNLLNPNPAQDGPTPPVNSITISVIDPPNRFAPGFLNPALNLATAGAVGNYSLVGDRVGQIAITNPPVITNVAPVVAGGPATATIELHFASPLPDDRYTLTILDNIVDVAGNRLDGESNAAAPGGATLPSGDGAPGGNFVARFTVDSRPEIGSWVAQNVGIDINGNFTWDPAPPQIGGDATNVDLSFTLPVSNADGTIGLGGFAVHDQLFSGQFIRRNGITPARLFDRLAAYGNSSELGAFRWIIDTDGDGIVRIGTDVLTLQPALPAETGFNVATATPVAGDFNPALAGDEIGLYSAGRWVLDIDGDNIIESSDQFITGGLLGYAVVGDFDGDGLDDLAVYNSNTWFFDLANDGLGDANTGAGGADLVGDDVDATFVWGFPGVLDRPLAADMDQDGIDDIGLWLPGVGSSPPIAAKWRFLVSNDSTAANRVAGQINTIAHAFTAAPTGHDLFAEFGNERSRPIVGNFSTPQPVQPTPPAPLTADYDGNGRVDQADYDVWRRDFGSTTDLAADGNRNGRVDTADFLIWRANLGRVVTAAALISEIAASDGLYSPSEQQTSAFDSFYTAIANQQPNLHQSMAHFAPARRSRFNTAAADAVLADLKIILADSAETAGQVSLARPAGSLQISLEENPSDNIQTLQAAWEKISQDVG
jgi:hypothetical protein